jgi:uncharacterized protein YjiS (DUF1127 family)
MTQVLLIQVTFIQAAISGLVDIVKQLKASYKLNVEIRQTIKQLSRLSDKELTDIGISRGDIHSVANGSSDHIRRGV